jgi:hypothetical protein
MNLNWKQIMATISGDDRFYMNTEEDEVTEKEAGWEFLRMYGKDDDDEDDEDDEDSEFSEAEAEEEEEELVRVVCYIVFCAGDVSVLTYYHDNFVWFHAGGGRV